MLSLIALLLVADAAGPASTPAADTFTLDPVLPSEADRRLPWSPRGTQLQWSERPGEDFPAAIRRFADDLIDPVFGRFTLGSESAGPRPFILARIDGGREHRERLVIDCDGDGRIDPEREVFDVEAHESRGRMWVSHGEVVIDINYRADDTSREEDVAVPHEFSFWHTYPREGEQRDNENILRYSRRSWMEGTVELHGRTFIVQIIDANNDAQYTDADRWTLAVDDDRDEEGDVEGDEGGSASEGDADQSPATYTTDARFGIGLDEPFFIDGQAYRLIDVDVSATRATLRPTDDIPDPPEDDEDDAPDRPQSDHELAWHDDFDAARRIAESQSRPLFVKWTAVWCGPCKRMDREAFRDKIVVDLLRDAFVIVELDYDEQYKLADKQDINAVPTLLIFDADGEETDRRRGLQTPEQMEDWLTAAVGDGEGN